MGVHQPTDSQMDFKICWLAECSALTRTSVSHPLLPRLNHLCGISIKARSGEQAQGNGFLNTAAEVALIRPVQVEVGQDSSMESASGHQVLPLAKELVVADGCWVRESLFLKGVVQDGLWPPSNEGHTSQNKCVAQIYFMGLKKWGVRGQSWMDREGDGSERMSQWWIWSKHTV